MAWFRDRALTIVLMLCFALGLAGQVIAGHRVYNQEQREHQQREASLGEYLATGHPWAALFENWESEFLQMAVFVLLTTRLVQRGSPESRRPHMRELVDADPRDFAHLPDAPWPVKRGGWILWLYERSLGLALIALFLLSWVGHAIGGWRTAAADDASHGVAPESFNAFLASPRFWFESFQNWQSEFLSIAAMVWLAVYLRQRGSPESKPVHAPHHQAD
ncbi:MAG TPA: DUF6766 family protein [Vicinamibacterales bacterium]|nr:DUF6766 family protein [Vicinamibacterales bacterium]